MKRLFLLWFAGIVALQVYSAEEISIAEFIQRHDQTEYILSGQVQNITNTFYGNFTLEDQTGSLIVWGLLDTEGVAKRFAYLGIGAGDSVYVRGVYTLYEDPNTHEKKHEIQNARLIKHVSQWETYAGVDGIFYGSLYVTGLTEKKDSILLSPERLVQPEESANWLWNGDSTQFKVKEAWNKFNTYSLYGDLSSDTIRSGAIVTDLRARMVGDRLLRLNAPLSLQNNTLPSTPPDLGNPSLVICGTNIENYFYHWDKMTGAAQSAEKFTAQTNKIANALLNINADIYAVCEIECGPTAGNHLAAKMNELSGRDCYRFVNNNFPDSAIHSSGFIYRKDKVELTGYYWHPYAPPSAYYYRMVMRSFKERSSGETFVVSVNHFKSKAGNYDSEATRQHNANSLLNALNKAKNDQFFGTDKFIILGDFNNYTCEWANYNIAAQYADMLPHSNPEEDYSYVYHGQTGYLDRAFASAELQPYITAVHPYHINTDVSLAHAYYNFDESIYRYADHDPILVGLRFKEDSSTGVENVQNSEFSVQKILRNGQVCIIRGEKVYTITGELLK